MATIRASFQLLDNVTPVLRPMINTLNVCAASFEAVNNAANRAFNTAKIATTTTEIVRTSAAMDSVADETARTSTAMNNVHNNIQKSTAAQRQFNAEVQQGQSGTEALAAKAKNVAIALLAAVGAGKITSMSDTVAQTNARLDLMNDKQQTTAQLQQMIFESAQRSRGAYQTTADAVAKLGMQAGHAFKSNAELIAFTEQLNKTFVIAGTNAVGVDSAMLQLTQSMAAGRLQGEELGAVLENAQPIVANIQRYLQNVHGMPKSVTDNIKKLASDGVLTAEIIKNAMFYAAEETNAKFATMPVTFGQVWTSITDNAKRSFEPVLKMIGSITSSTAMNTLLNGTIAVMPVIGALVANTFTAITESVKWGIDTAASTLMFFGNVAWSIMPVATGLLAGYGAFWLVANANMLANAGISTIVAAKTWAITTAQTAWALITGKLIVAQRLLNLTLAFNPIGLVIGLVVGAIAIFSAWQVKTYGIRQTFADVFGSIVDTVQAAVNFIVSSINSIIRSFNAIGGFVGNVMGFEYSKVAEIAYRADFSGIKSSGQDFIKNFSVESLTKPPEIASADYSQVGNTAATTAANTAATAANTGKMKDSLDISTEDLKYLRDIAEQEVINRYTTAEIKIDMPTSNNISSNMDLDGVANHLRDSLVEAVQTAAEKVHK